MAISATESTKAGMSATKYEMYDGCVWSECASACDKTCEQPNPVCIFVCVNRCACPNDKPIVYNGQCIALNQCPTNSSDSSDEETPLTTIAPQGINKCPANCLTYFDGCNSFVFCFFFLSCFCFVL